MSFSAPLRVEIVEILFFSWERSQAERYPPPSWSPSTPPQILIIFISQHDTERPLGQIQPKVVSVNVERRCLHLYNHYDLNVKKLLVQVIRCWFDLPGMAGYISTRLNLRGGSGYSSSGWGFISIWVYSLSVHFFPQSVWSLGLCRMRS